MKRQVQLILLVGSFVAGSAFGQIADFYFYKITPGKNEEAYSLLSEATDLGDKTGMNIIAHQQSLGPGGEAVVSWIELYDDAADRAKTRYKGEEWAAYFEKWYAQTALRPLNSYSMTALDDIEPGVYVIDSYTWSPKPNMFDETLSAMLDVKEIFEEAGYKVDIWRHGVGGTGHLQFVMLSDSWEDRAKNEKSILNDPRWIAMEPIWWDSRELADPVESSLMYNIKLESE